MVRGERPELSAALADILTSTATALRQFAGDAGGEPEPAAGAPAPPTAPASPVQRIELS
jgi:hypothetical protein